jgi:hypothetical protein
MAIGKEKKRGKERNIDRYSIVSEYKVSFTN